MSHNTPPTTQTARKEHRCTNCGEAILPGQQYSRWVTFEDCATTNKMHPECLLSNQHDAERYSVGEWEYTLYGGERPAVGEFGRTA